MIYFIIFMILIALIVVDWKANPQECGIPIREWILVFLAIIVVSALVDLAKLCMISCNFEGRH